MADFLIWLSTEFLLENISNHKHPVAKPRYEIFFERYAKEWQLVTE